MGEFVGIFFLVLLMIIKLDFKRFNMLFLDSCQPSQFFLYNFLKIENLSRFQIKQLRKSAFKLYRFTYISGKKFATFWIICRITGSAPLERYKITAEGLFTFGPVMMKLPVSTIDDVYFVNVRNNCRHRCPTINTGAG